MAKFIPMAVIHYTKPQEIKKQNDYLDYCAKKGKLRGVRRDKNNNGESLTFANYYDNSMYTMQLNKKGFITKITRW